LDCHAQVEAIDHRNVVKAIPAIAIECELS
jgi:hypothetical protein